MKFAADAPLLANQHTLTFVSSVDFSRVPPAVCEFTG
jgi:hypothetical protein